MLIERMRKWRHAFKLDPNRALSNAALERICLSGTDVVIVSGTDGITYENSERLVSRISAYPIDCVQEVSRAEAVVPGVEGYLLPTVLNADDTRWIVGAQQRAVKSYGDWIPWEDTAGVGYIVLNPDSRVGRLTGSQTDLTSADIIAYTRLAEHLFHLPALYIEYSGRWGDPSMVKAAQEAAKRLHLFYGGGINGPDEARRMASLVDTVVIGNLAHRNVDAALTTVEAVKETRKQMN
ncbi:heptaprenylglyceryl phosphate synthase [Desmospora profundinema]|uniref:Glycerol-1-phosphate prenyltransferase n=1 Tax=Desmospora profundinema TaxID=1571184 RepID=A0ABU1IMC6_9BACL|nr:heptaprenylglyceryl phosphate synthase [Desmospora profundinema]MDR6225893.1 putative glycerol-1-phosphate prenyltransferase [Desmospora profundinema]